VATASATPSPTSVIWFDPTEMLKEINGLKREVATLRADVEGLQRWARGYEREGDGK
jgi:hypothetical protein